MLSKGMISLETEKLTGFTQNIMHYESWEQSWPQCMMQWRSDGPYCTLQVIEQGRPPDSMHDVCSYTEFGLIVYDPVSSEI
jgi:hypothetical protein